MYHTAQGASDIDIATHYVDVRTRAMAHWMRHGDQEPSYSWRSGSTVYATEALAVCRADLAAHLQRIVENMRKGRGFDKPSVGVIEAAIPEVESSTDVRQLDELRARFGLPTIEETARPQELPTLSFADRHRHRPSYIDTLGPGFFADYGRRYGGLN